jgi:hypothetical protein
MNEKDLCHVDKELRNLLATKVIFRVGRTSTLTVTQLPIGKVAFMAPTFPIPKKLSTKMRVIIDHKHVIGWNKLPTWFTANSFLSKHAAPVRFPKIRQFFTFIRTLVETLPPDTQLFASVWDLTGAYH